MKWKLTGRYVFSIVLVVIIVLFINIFVLIGSLVTRVAFNLSFFPKQEFSPEEFTRDFQSEIVLNNSMIQLSAEGEKKLDQQNAWLQVLDEDGRELFDYKTPENLQEKYTPSEIVQMYKYREIDYTTVFVGEKSEDSTIYSYLIGIEDPSLNRYFISYDNQELQRLVKISGVILFIDALIALLIGYFFSKYLTQPLHLLIRGIQQLANKEYNLSFPAQGVYGDVFYNVNVLSEELKTSEKEREKLETMRKEWIGNVSHDIKTPLASIQGYAELIKDPVYNFSAEEMREYAGIIEEKSLYIEDLINDLNITTRLQDQSLVLNKAEVNVVSLLRKIIIDILNDSKYSNREINFQPEQEEILMAVDEVLFKRAINNLIYNAIVHNDEDVKIEIEIKKSPHIHLKITDDGRGIKKEDLENIFDRYYRGTNTGDMHKGSGLGMVIAKDIIEAHGGKIEIKSDVNKGTTAKIRF